MKTAYLCIQCPVKPGDKVAKDFLYSTRNSDKSYNLVSPAFDNLDKLFRWADANGWQALPYDPEHPVGSYAQYDVL